MQANGDYEIFPICTEVPSNLQTINFYLLKTGDSLALVDAGVNHTNYWNQLEETLHNQGFSLNDLTEIVLTHNHVDHVGLVNRITAAHPIPVYAHQEAIPRLKRDPEFLEMRVEFFEKLYEEMGCKDAGKKQVHYLKQAITNNQNQRLQADITPIKDNHLGFQIMHTPGHAPDHIVLYHEQNKVLIGGDLLIEHISSNALIEPDKNGNQLPTLLQHKQSMEKMHDLPIKLIYPGHGILIEDSKTLIDQRLRGIDRKAGKIKNLIRDKQWTASEIAQAYYHKNYEKQFSLVMSEIIGHLDYLENNQQVIKEKTDGIWYYSVNG